MAGDSEQRQQPQAELELYSQTRRHWLCRDASARQLQVQFEVEGASASGSDFPAGTSATKHESSSASGDSDSESVDLFGLDDELVMLAALERDGMLFCPT